MRIPRATPIGLLLFTLVLGCLTTATGYAPSFRATVSQEAAPAASVPLPNRADSLKFAVLGDFGNGTRQQRELAAQMASLHDTFPFELVITVGDNIYGSDNVRSVRERFEQPYQALLGAGVKFHASLGNHDTPEFQRYYALFNMGGQLYYTFKAPRQDVRFFALHSEYMTVEQIGWLERELTNASERWKIPYFHHPLYSSADRHGSNLPLRRILEPIFIKHGVTVVFAGHDHVYERTHPQNGIVHFVVGAGGQLRRGDLDRSAGITASGYDEDRSFVAVEINGDELFFNAISRTGQIVDSGVITLRQPQ